jgi:hypothetical protein
MKFGSRATRAALTSARTARLEPTQ